MLPTATIVFREILEIALIVSLVMASTTGMSGRLHLILTGLGLGFAGAGVIAFFTDSISSAMEGFGQEIFNATILFIAVGFLSWTVIWMKHHSMQMVQKIKKIGGEVVAGDRSKYVIVGIVAFASLREGAEIVLFTFGMVASNQFTWESIFAGAALGAAGGLIVGVLLYAGILRAAKKHLLTVTSWMLILLTAGMAAHGASYLIAADILPTIVPQLWDTSGIISGEGLIGQILGVLLGYTPRPSGMEVIIYLSVITIITFFMYRPWNNIKQNKLAKE